MSEKELNKTMEQGFITLRRCAFNDKRICDKSCISLERVTISNVFGVEYRGLYCMRGGFKIDKLIL